jgi:hypothetical protein
MFTQHFEDVLLPPKSKVIGTPNHDR